MTHPRSVMRSGRPTFALFALVSALLLPSIPAVAQVMVKRGIAIYAPFMDRSPANMRYFNRTFGDPNLLIEKNVLSDIRSAGFDTVRIPVAPRPLLEQDGERLEASIKEVARGVDLVLSAGLKAMIDIHVGFGGQPWQHSGLTKALDAPETARYLTVVERLAARLSKFDQSRIIYEPFNEPPCARPDRPDWSLFMKAIYDRVRRVAPMMTVVITGACWSNWDALIKVDPSQFDGNTLFTFHFYDPHIFTHQGTQNSGDASHYVSRLPYPAVESDNQNVRRALQDSIARSKLSEIEKQAVAKQGQLYFDRYFSDQGSASGMAKRMSAVAEWADRHKIARSRIFVGEFGVTKDMTSIVAANPADRIRWFADARAAFEKAGFGWVAWNYHYQGGLITGDEWGPLDPDILGALGLKVPAGRN